MLLNKNIQNIPDLHQRLWFGTDGFYPYDSRQSKHWHCIHGCPMCRWNNLDEYGQINHTIPVSMKNKQTKNKQTKKQKKYKTCAYTPEQTSRDNIRLNTRIRPGASNAALCRWQQVLHVYICGNIYELKSKTIRYVRKVSYYLDQYSTNILWLVRRDKIS